ncbi:MAG: AraC family transcriptional regulator [Mycobacterium sp.]|uniref:AraC family transcriptional regulator n=1 Tax=Mycobacterium sp. TaxID=1785 RepID=UPI000CB96EE7|nr:AraC family transcriptional regulator [Mycobacterium sp.]MBI2703116.1 AraC family transcriptional regulator [Mycobacterium sp.]PJE05742.1 MAG: AraC family transcriptional regulator [Mycobacterium sp.]PJE13331.1 MAG: AraC family transcriptional regulator [Mycobacterium sp.]
MTFSAQTATILSCADTPALVDMRQGGTCTAGAFVYEGQRVTTARHAHDLHQLEYVVQGVLEVETDAGAYVLSERQAAWIPAGLGHISTIDTRARSVSIFLHPIHLQPAHSGAGIVMVSPLIRQMIMYACRWPIDRDPSDPLADTYFRCFAELLAELLGSQSPFSLPTTTHPQLGAALKHTRNALASITIDDAAAAAGMSPRSLRRLCHRELQMTWRDYTQQARLMRAAALLADSELSVLQVATRVGFDSASSFTRAFRSAWGRPPSAYRRHGSELPA